MSICTSWHKRERNTSEHDWKCLNQNHLVLFLVSFALLTTDIFQTRYIKDCKRLYGRILDCKNVRSSIQAKSKDRSEKVWTELYPGEPFDLEYSGSPSDDSVYVGDETAGGISYDLVSAVKRQSSFVYQVVTLLTFALMYY